MNGIGILQFPFHHGANLLLDLKLLRARAAGLPREIRVRGEELPTLVVAQRTGEHVEAGELAGAHAAEQVSHLPQITLPKITLPKMNPPKKQ